MAYHFRTGNNIIKLLTEYESVTQKVLLFSESILQNTKQLQYMQFYFVVLSLKITGYGNTDNNLELHCVMHGCLGQNSRYITVNNVLIGEMVQ
jgi:hypothetical protein